MTSIAAFSWFSGVDSMDPNTALILIAIGVACLFLEFSAPGLIVPGVGGSVLAMIGIAALSRQPLSFEGLGLILLGAGLFVMEAKYVSRGILAAGAALSLLLGASMLIDSPDPEKRIHTATAIALVLPLAFIAGFLIRLAAKARKNKIATGIQAMIGQEGVALEELQPEGRVLVRGEYWLARAEPGIARGMHVRVTGVAKLRLRVEPALGD